LKSNDSELRLLIGATVSTFLFTLNLLSLEHQIPFQLGGSLIDILSHYIIFSTEVI